MSEPTPEPFTIDAATLYPMSWLRGRLRGIVGLDTLLDRTGLRQRRRFRDALLGSELLAALERLDAYGEDEGREAEVVPVRGMRGGAGERRGRSGGIRRLGAKDLQ